MTDPGSLDSYQTRSAHFPATLFTDRQCYSQPFPSPPSPALAVFSAAQVIQSSVIVLQPSRSCEPSSIRQKNPNSYALFLKERFSHYNGKCFHARNKHCRLQFSICPRSPRKLLPLLSLAASDKKVLWHPFSLTSFMRFASAAARITRTSLQKQVKRRRRSFRALPRLPYTPPVHRPQTGQCSHRYRNAKKLPSPFKITEEDSRFIEEFPKPPYPNGRAVFASGKLKGLGKDVSNKLGEVSAEWTKLSEAQKHAFEQQAQQELRRYRDTLTKFLKH